MRRGSYCLQLHKADAAIAAGDATGAPGLQGLLYLLLSLLSSAIGKKILKPHHIVLPVFDFEVQGCSTFSLFSNLSRNIKTAILDTLHQVSNLNVSRLNSVKFIFQLFGCI